MHSPITNIYTGLDTIFRLRDISIIKNVSSLMFFLIGWFVLYMPVYIEMYQNAWIRDENSHAPFLLAFCLVVFSINFIKTNASNIKLSVYESLFSIALLAVGFLFYFIGRFYQIDLILSFSQLPIIIGSALWLGGKAFLRKAWFPLGMFIYLVVWPGWILDGFTAPLKQWISNVVALLLTAFDYPVAQSGVVLVIGPYQMLVADACSGINSLISLTMIGAIYLYVTQGKNWLTNILIFLSVIPIAIFANIIRVVILMLLTHHYGYDVGQGFLHDFAGFLLFGIGLCGVFIVDSLLTKNRRVQDVS